MDLSTSSTNHSCISIGEDGCIRLWDYTKKVEYYQRMFRGKGTALAWLPATTKIFL